jgi:hypothetical protein
MGRLISTVADWEAGRDELLRRRYGVIEATAGGAIAVHLRPWPKLVSWREIWPVGPSYHARGQANCCLLYYNQPRRFPNYLALKYVVSTRGTTYATIRAALVALDRLAELKGADALLCDAANTRISDRLLARLGWEAHAPARWRRNFIKRFYGAYPAAR